jgi:hypothetical protein
MRYGWIEPVEIELGKIGLYTVIPDTETAGRTLLFEWPVKQGEALSLAKTACLEALEGKGSAEAARDAYLAAADEAGLNTRRAQRYIPEGRSAGQRWGKRRRA